MERTAEEKTEIERHKYFLSEKQGYDVGWEFAETDWEEHYGQKWRTENSEDARNTSMDSNSSKHGQTQQDRRVREDAVIDSSLNRFHIGSLIARFFKRPR